MNDQQIRERCRATLEKFTEAEHCKSELDVLESLYREAMAAGLERAFRHIEGMVDTPGSSEDQMWAHAEWCLAEAQRVKETT